MNLSLQTAPASEPVTAAEVKNYAKIDSGVTTDDTLIDALITAARLRCEQYTRRALINQTWDLGLDYVPTCDFIELPKAPLSSVTSVTSYVDGDTATVFSASNYNVNTWSQPGKIILRHDAVWPDGELRTSNPMVIRFVAGYGASASNVPAALRAAILQMVLAWYENRGDEAQSDAMAIPAAAKALMNPYRVIWGI